MRKIATIVGARPQFIKAAAVSRALRKSFHEVLVHTGQHYDGNMSQVFFDELDIPRPDYDLGIGSGGHGAQTGAMLAAIEEILLKEKPDRVLVYGDTNSTLAGALAAVKLHIPVAHVEAGLRSFNRRMPEEINRVLTDHVADLLFCPSETAVAHLAAEGICKGVHRVGDVMFEALMHAASAAKRTSDALARWSLVPGAYALATIHRAENTDDPDRLARVVEALGEVSRRLPVVFPVHPRTRGKLRSLPVPGDLRLVEPQGYLDMVRLESEAAVVLTDSGGVQKEAYWLRVPCVTLREETEWVETVQQGWNVLAGCDRERIVRSAQNAVRPKDGPDAYQGAGSVERLVEILAKSGMFEG
ncbi:MAG: non-hydrolyzing UDP-N-acetylglucosamine 2-epimerase [Kiritimatiellia bacterium]